MKKPERIYYYRGQIEHVTSGGHRPVRARWLNGYSRGTPTQGWQPWMGKRECWAEARRDGVKAEFVEAYDL